MTIFKNFKNQSLRFMIRIKTLRYFRVRSSALECKTKIAHNKMDKKRLRVALKVLGKLQFPETEQFMEEVMEQIRSEYAKRYCIKLNSLGYNIYLRVI